MNFEKVEKPVPYEYTDAVPHYGERYEENGKQVYWTIVTTTKNISEAMLLIDNGKTPLEAKEVEDEKNGKYVIAKWEVIEK